MKYAYDYNVAGYLLLIATFRKLDEGVINIMGKKRSISMLIGVMALGSLYSMSSAFAIPSLQLNIVGGTYNNATETIIAGSDPFTLQAFLIDDGANTTLADTYFISASVLPKVGTPTNLGSFDFAGTTVNVTSDLVYGTAPIDTVQASDPGDLAPHGVFPTYFGQFDFTFAASQFSQAFNTQDDAGMNTSTWVSGDKMYYQEFVVDTRNLDPNHFIHFDLYNTKTGKKAVTDTDIKSFAPFSHDAESYHFVPEPGILMLFGIGLVGLGLSYRRV